MQLMRVVVSLLTPDALPTHVLVDVGVVQTLKLGRLQGVSLFGLSNGLMEFRLLLDGELLSVYTFVIGRRILSISGFSPGRRHVQTFDLCDIETKVLQLQLLLLLLSPIVVTNYLSQFFYD